MQFPYSKQIPILTLLVTLLVLSFVITPVAAAWSAKGPYVNTAYVSGDKVGHHTYLVQYNYVMGQTYTDTRPRLYAELMTVGEWPSQSGFYMWPVYLEAKVRAFDPSGNSMPGSRFTSLGLLVGPDEYGQDIELYLLLLDALCESYPNLIPVNFLIRWGLNDHGTSMGQTTSYAYASFTRYALYPSYEDSQASLRFGFNFDVYPDMEGRYHIYIDFKTHLNLVGHSSVKVLTNTIHLTYDYVSGGGGGGGGGDMVC